MFACDCVWVWFLCVCVCVGEMHELWQIAQNGKLLKDMEVQSKEIKDLCVANGAMKEQLANLLKDTDLHIKAVRKVGHE